MKLARFEHAGSERIGLVDIELSQVQPVIAAPGAIDEAIAVISDLLANCEPVTDGEPVPFSAVRWVPPIRRPSKNVLCIGKNYRAHAQEFARSGFDSSSTSAADAVPDAPIVFSKAACSLNGAHDPILVPPALAHGLDYEGELGIVIGRPGRAISRASALEHVWGCTVINDMTARDLQSRHKQWLLGKSIDTFCPIGPWIVSADELDLDDLELSCWVNGELRQHANTRDLVFDIPTLIETISASMTLETGDIIATGTPAGVGIGFDPPRFLAADDVVRVAISGIGEIENRVVILRESP